MESTNNAIPTRNCAKCGPKPLTEFKRYRKYKNSEKEYFFSYCNACRNKVGRKRAEKKHGKNHSPSQLKNRAKKRLVLKIARATEIRGPIVAKLIIYHSRQRCKQIGFEHTISVQTAEWLIARPCTYCGENELKMTLDRRDNDKGYVEDNVVPACIRCNLIRGDMPYEAWMRIIPELRAAREDGLFKEWKRFTPGGGPAQKQRTSGSHPQSIP